MGAFSQRGQRRPHLLRLEIACAHLLVVRGDRRRVEFLDRMGEGVVADVVQQGGVGNQRGSVPHLRGDRPAGLQDADRALGEMVDAEGVIEARVGGAGVDEVRQAQLPDVAQPLEGGGIDDRRGCGIESNRVPHRITNDEGPSMVGHGRRH